MLDVIVLAGGKGRRLGALTHQKQKGVLNYMGKPILAHVLENISEIPFRTVWVVTGYRGEDVHLFLRNCRQIKEGKLKIIAIDAPHVFGELSRLSYALRQIPVLYGAILTGIDTILPSSVFENLAQASKIGKGSVIFAVSPRKEIAQTHRLVKLCGETVVSYHHREEVPFQDVDLYYVETGTRFYSKCTLKKLRDLNIPNNTDPDDFLKMLVQQQNKKARAVVFNEAWKHFGTSLDFRSQDK